MSWNYRVMAEPYNEDTYFKIIEVHYEDDKPVACPALITLRITTSRSESDKLHHAPISLAVLPQPIQTP